MFINIFCALQVPKDERINPKPESPETTKSSPSTTSDKQPPGSRRQHAASATLKDRKSMGNIESGLTESVINSHLSDRVLTSPVPVARCRGNLAAGAAAAAAAAILQDQDVPDLTESLAETLVQNEASTDGGSPEGEELSHISLQELDQDDLAALLPEVPSSPATESRILHPVAPSSTSPPLLPGIEHSPSPSDEDAQVNMSHIQRPTNRGIL